LGDILTYRIDPTTGALVRIGAAVSATGALTNVGAPGAAAVSRIAMIVIAQAAGLAAPLAANVKVLVPPIDRRATSATNRQDSPYALLASLGYRE
jgi:hypothetical protein